MKSINARTKTTLQVALLAVLASLVGCGGGVEPAPRICLVLLLIPVPCSAGTPSSAPPPTQAPPSSTPPPYTPPPATTPPPSTGTGGSSGQTAVITRVYEFEPNSTLDNANVAQFPAAPPESKVGLDIVGNVQETDDPADFFILTPNRSAHYRIVICSETCVYGVEDDAVYLMLYDQNQTTIAGTPVGTIEEQKLIVELTAGLAYYVGVHGYNTGPIAYEYRLAIID